MTDTANLALPCIEGSQAQKHVTHNEALRILDSLVQLSVLDRDQTAPPGSPSEGQRWIVKTGATGAWAGHGNAIAAWQDSTWQFSTPRTGWLAYVVDETALLAWNGSAWVTAIGALTALNNLTLLGINAIADATNPLSAKLNNALFAARTVAEGGDGHLRYKLSKESAAKTLSFLFQDNFSGRAEIGLTGDDDFRFKVSADGTTWRDGIVIAAGTGAVTFPNSTIAGGRELLTANRTYYVRTDGSDGNNGLANSSGGAFLTIQKAIDVVASIDCSIYQAIIQVGAGTYTAGLTLSKTTGALPPLLKGDLSTPVNCLISTASVNAISVASFASWRLQGFKLVTTTAGTCISCSGQSAILIDGNMEYGACASVHIAVGRGGYANITSGYSISGNALQHLGCGTGGIIVCEGGGTVTLSGTPTFASSFVTSAGAGFVRATGMAYSGAATGTRYSASSNGVIETGGSGANFFPGNSAGSTSTGGQYS